MQTITNNSNRCDIYNPKWRLIKSPIKYCPHPLNQSDESPSQSAVRLNDRSIHATTECLRQFIMYYKCAEQLQRFSFSIGHIPPWTEQKKQNKETNISAAQTYCT